MKPECTMHIACAFSALMSSKSLRVNIPKGDDKNTGAVNRVDSLSTG